MREYSKRPANGEYVDAGRDQGGYQLEVNGMWAVIVSNPEYNVPDYLIALVGSEAEADKILAASIEADPQEHHD
jgi:hypothetical protein